MQIRQMDDSNSYFNKIGSKNEGSILVHDDLESLPAIFKGILLDAYGVYWGGNGVGLLPGSKDAMARLVEQGKIVGILTNITQIANHEIEKLKNNGLLQGVHYHFVITSGEVSRKIFLRDDLPFPTPNKKFFLFGTVHPKFVSHQFLFEGTTFQETMHLHEADFIYISVPHIQGIDQTESYHFNENLKEIIYANLPMLCTNPDHFAQEGNPPKAVVRQGLIANLYEKLGGCVYYIGKPSKGMFQAAMQNFLNFGIVNPAEIVMVGDTPETDIRGANNFGMSSALVVKTGMMAERIVRSGWEESVERLAVQDYPNYFIGSLGKHEI